MFFIQEYILHIFKNSFNAFFFFCKTLDACAHIHSTPGRIFDQSQSYSHFVHVYCKRSYSSTTSTFFLYRSTFWIPFFFDISTFILHFFIYLINLIIFSPKDRVFFSSDIFNELVNNINLSFNHFSMQIKINLLIEIYYFYFLTKKNGTLQSPHYVVNIMQQHYLELLWNFKMLCIQFFYNCL